MKRSMKSNINKIIGILLAFCFVLSVTVAAASASYSVKNDHTTISSMKLVKPKAIIKVSISTPQRESANSGEAPLTVTAQDISRGTVLYKKWYIDGQIVSKDQTQMKISKTFYNNGPYIQYHEIKLVVSNGPNSDKVSYTVKVYPQNRFGGSGYYDYY